ncbi:hypothetical protein [Gluconobacter oxydans]|uniref:hypothetical protein n=1 Tax=Gluconobacter oxydans TaxID=442 RepID=UPI003454E6FA
MMTFRKISAECNGKFVAAYFTEGAPDPEHDFRTDSGKVPDGDGQRLTNYYLGRDGRASFNPGMSQRMADVLGWIDVQCRRPTHWRLSSKASALTMASNGPRQSVRSAPMT